MTNRLAPLGSCDTTLVKSSSDLTGTPPTSTSTTFLLLFPFAAGPLGLLPTDAKVPPARAWDMKTPTLGTPHSVAAPLLRSWKTAPANLTYRSSLSHVSPFWTSMTMFFFAPWRYTPSETLALCGSGASGAPSAALRLLVYLARFSPKALPSTEYTMSPSFSFPRAGLPGMIVLTMATWGGPPNMDRFCFAAAALGRR